MAIQGTIPRLETLPPCLKSQPPTMPLEIRHHTLEFQQRIMPLETRHYTLESQPLSMPLEIRHHTLESETIYWFLMIGSKSSHPYLSFRVSCILTVAYLPFLLEKPGRTLQLMKEYPMPHQAIEGRSEGLRLKRDERRGEWKLSSPISHGAHG